MTNEARRGEAFCVLASPCERCAAKRRAMQKLPQTVDQQWGNSAVVWHTEAGITRLPDARALLKSILRPIKSCVAIFQNRAKCTKRRSWCRLSQRSNVWFLSESIWHFLKGSCDRLYFPSGLVGMMGWDWGQWVDDRYIINNAFRRFLFDVAFSIWVKSKKNKSSGCTKAAFLEEYINNYNKNMTPIKTSLRYRNKLTISLHLSKMFSWLWGWNMYLKYLFPRVKKKERSQEAWWDR